MRLILAILSLIVVGALSRPEDTEDQNVVGRQSKLGFLGSTTNTLSQLAQDLFARSTTSSQVLSLNLTNLVILLVVKALIFGAGSLGFGGRDNAARSIDGLKRGNVTTNESFVSESELLLILSYLKGDITHKYGCLNFAACQDPQKAKEYLLASNFLVKGANMFKLSSDSDKYEDVLAEVDEAVKFGTRGYDCTTRYTCQEKS